MSDGYITYYIEKEQTAQELIDTCDEIEND